MIESCFFWTEFDHGTRNTSRRKTLFSSLTQCFVYTVKNYDHVLVFGLICQDFGWSEYGPPCSTFSYVWKSWQLKTRPIKYTGSEDVCEIPEQLFLFNIVFLVKTQQFNPNMYLKSLSFRSK